jgi:hypothetical protein
VIRVTTSDERAGAPGPTRSRTAVDDAFQRAGAGRRAHPYAGSSPGNRGAAAERLDATTLRAVRRASITGTFVTAKSGDKAARFLTLLPWAIYPMKPDACAS